jgi:site-specific DNA-methyltransferase (adenine-specific)/modification methylase
MAKAIQSNAQLDNIINKLFEGDCLQYMKEIPDESVDLILCDLPYGLRRINGIAIYR